MCEQIKEEERKKRSDYSKHMICNARRAIPISDNIEESPTHKAPCGVDQRKMKNSSKSLISHEHICPSYSPTVRSMSKSIYQVYLTDTRLMNSHLRNFRKS